MTRGHDEYHKKINLEIHMATSVGQDFLTTSQLVLECSEIYAKCNQKITSIIRITSVEYSIQGESFGRAFPLCWCPTLAEDHKNQCNRSQPRAGNEGENGD